MSGGSGGGYIPSSPSGDCDIVERVPLNSPQRAVVANLKVGDVLRVVPVGRALEAQTESGQTAGSLTPKTLLDLLDCIQKGRRYVAAVVNRAGALCEVEIRPAP